MDSHNLNYSILPVQVISAFVLGFKCIDISCPQGYEVEGSLSAKRCKLKPEDRLCSDPQNVECLRRPISLSFNFIALISKLRVTVGAGPSQLGIDLFTMQSARYYTLTTKFTLSLIQVRAAKDVGAKVDRAFFRLKTPEPHRHSIYNYLMAIRSKAQAIYLFTSRLIS